MGNSLVRHLQNEPLPWQDYEIIDNNQQDNILYLRCAKTNEEFIGKEISCSNRDDIQQMQRLIDEKMSDKNMFLNRLVRVAAKKEESYCNKQSLYYMLFQKPALSMRDQSINRKFKFQVFQETQILFVLQAAMKGLLFLKAIGEPHQRICSQNIFLRSDRTVMLSDPWLYPMQYTSIYNLQINGYIYPSPEKILHQNDLVDKYDQYLSDYYSLGVVLLELIYQQLMDIIYEKGFRKILDNRIVQMVGKVKNQELKLKLRILLAHQPQKRKQIQQYYASKLSPKLAFINHQRQNFKNHYINQVPPNAKQITENISIHPPPTPIQKISINQKIHEVNANLLIQKQPKIVSYNTAPDNRIKIVINNSKYVSYNSNSFSKNVSQMPYFSPHQPIINSQTSYPPASHLANLPILALPLKISQSINSQAILPLRIKQQNKSLLIISKAKQQKQTAISSCLDFSIVKNSIEQNNNLVGSKNSDNINPKIIDLNNLIKEVQSLNASSDQKSQGISEVIGHGFNSKESSSFGLNSVPENFKHVRSSLPQPSVSQNAEQKIKQQSKLKQTQSYRIESPSVSKTVVKQNKKSCEQTPENKPTKRRYNSTIKQVSEDSRSFQSNQAEKQVREVNYDTGNRYIGQLKNDKRDGKGIFYYDDGSHYEGDWKENRMHGNGRYLYSDGRLGYEGSWYNDTFHGKGKIYNQKYVPIDQPFNYCNMNAIDDYWEVYDGDFFYQKWSGKGKLKLSNGEVYVGEFMENKVNGIGKFYTQNGEVILGKWFQGNLIQQYN